MRSVNVGSPLVVGGNPTCGGRGRTPQGGTVQAMELVVFAMLFVGLALLAAVPLVAMLHLSERRGLNDR
ncbi:hypothetical protein GCM10010185_06680 [Saccharothrix coeruleofusca]|uniref:Uncharacterized protein n=1 Tax=Saccharothrix coeruleofusca TaxID=33919 RepID=A0A918ECR5_9PSEU|nr:hypothetical protein GCM10010185_06680 [Saccharothrix coeruleofusca]